MKNIYLLLISLMTTFYGFSQKTINVTVSDDQGPLPGATIIIQGSSTGVTTDFDGNYSIEASEGDVLEFSYIGMEGQTVTVSNIPTAKPSGDNFVRGVRLYRSVTSASASDFFLLDTLF